MTLFHYIEDKKETDLRDLEKKKENIVREESSAALKILINFKDQRGIYKTKDYCADKIKAQQL